MSLQGRLNVGDWFGGEGKHGGGVELGLLRESL